LIKPSIVFFGTGPVAAKSLELLTKNFDIEAVITKPKPATYRGEYPVISVAKKNNLNTLYVTDNSSTVNLVNENKFSSRVAVLIDFGIIVSELVIDSFPLGIVNSHFSILPEWRGADPITFSILSGQKKTGVSLMLIEEGMDTGEVLGQRSIDIDANDTSHSLTEKLIDLSDNMLIEYIPRYLEGSLKPRRQPHPDRATYSRKLTKQDGDIDWNKPAQQIEREVRAFVDWPKSRTTLGSVEVIITKAHVLQKNRKDNNPGDIYIDEDAGLVMVDCKPGTLVIECLKPAGKNTMSAQEFIRGYKSKILSKI